MAITESFARFWSAYPRHVAKGAARRAFAKAVKVTDAETIIEGARRYGAERAGQDPRFTAHAATWLSGERWLDEPARAGPVIDQHGNAVTWGDQQPRSRSRPASYSEIAERMLTHARN